MTKLSKHAIELRFRNAYAPLAADLRPLRSIRFLEGVLPPLLSEQGAGPDAWTVKREKISRLFSGVAGAATAVLLNHLLRMRGQRRKPQ